MRSAGVALAVLAGACYLLYTAAAKALVDRGVAGRASDGGHARAGRGLLAPVPLARGAELATPRSLVMAAWLGLVTTTAAYLLFARGLRDLPAGTVGTLSLAEPLTAAALGLLVLGERPYPQLSGQDLTDTDGTVHPGLIPTGLPIRSAPPETFAALRHAAADARLQAVDFPTTGQQTTGMRRLAADVAATRPLASPTLGLASCGLSKAVRTLTGGLRLLR